MELYQCPSCEEIYSEFDNLYYCPKCRYRLKKIDETTARKKTQSITSKSTPIITCPYCQSTDTKKISGTSRWISTGLFGLASSKVGKQWHCNKCKSDF